MAWLTHWGWDKMAAISQTFSNAFSWMKMCAFCLRFRYSLFLRFELTIFQHWVRWWLGANQATSHYLSQWWLDYRCMYESLSLNVLTKSPGLHQAKYWNFLSSIFGTSILGKATVSDSCRRTSFQSHSRSRCDVTRLNLPYCSRVSSQLFPLYHV